MPTSSARRDPTFSQRPKETINKSILEEPLPPATIKPDENEDPQMTAKDATEEDDNLKALKRLRDLPRGTQVDSRIAAIDNLLGEGEIFKTLKMLRWPQGVICPRCHSTNVVRRDPPHDSVDKRHYYVCLNCKGEGGISDFDDFTGLPLNSLFALRQWILCWYLIGFCSVNQIAKVLGISLQEVIQIVTLGNEVTELPKKHRDELQVKEERRIKSKKAHEQGLKEGVVKQEQDTLSASKSPLKPGHKIKK
jgi:transposase-like protein